MYDNKTPNLPEIKPNKLPDPKTYNRYLQEIILAIRELSSRVYELEQKQGLPPHQQTNLF